MSGDKKNYTYDFRWQDSNSNGSGSWEVSVDGGRSYSPIDDVDLHVGDVANYVLSFADQSGVEYPTYATVHQCDPSGDRLAGATIHGVSFTTSTSAQVSFSPASGTKALEVTPCKLISDDPKLQVSSSGTTQLTLSYDTRAGWTSDAGSGSPPINSDTVLYVQAGATVTVNYTDGSAKYSLYTPDTSLGTNAAEIQTIKNTGDTVTLSSTLAMDTELTVNIFTTLTSSDGVLLRDK